MATDGGQSGHQHAVSLNYLPAVNAPFHWGHPRPPPSPTTTGVHHHGYPAHPSYPEQLQKPNKWIFGLCQEPDDDPETCCEGFWFPYALMGKIHYRMDQMHKQKDPADLSDYNCCNGPCWGLFFLNLFCLDSIAIMLTHASVRAMFSIEGSIGEDFAMGCFCGRCSLMMQDREIRAREKYCCVVHNHEARQSFAVSRQPSLQPEMVATPKESRHRGNKRVKKLVKNPPGCELQALKPAKVRTGSPLTAADHDILEGASSGNFTEGMEGTGSVLAPLKAMTRGDQSSHPTSKDRETIRARQPWRSKSGEKKRNDFIYPSQGKANTAMYNMFQAQEQAGASSSSPLPECETVADKCTENSQHTPEDSEEEVVVYYDDDKKGRPQRHRLADCARIRASTPGMANIPCYHHILSDDDVVSGDSSDSPKQSDLENCARASENSNESDSHLTTKLKHHSTESFNGTEATDTAQCDNVQHGQAGREKGIPWDKSKRPFPGNVEHVLAKFERDADASYKLDADPELQLHILKDCTVEEGDPGAKEKKPTKLHSLNSCSFETSVKEHGLEDSSPETVVEGSQAPGIHGLIECAQIVLAPSLPEVLDQYNVKEYTNKELKRDSAYTQLIATEQHNLVDCNIYSATDERESVTELVEQHLLSRSDPMKSTKAELPVPIPGHHELEENFKKPDDDNQEHRSRKSTSNKKQFNARRSSIGVTSATARSGPKRPVLIRAVSDVNKPSHRIHSLLEWDTISSNTSSNHVKEDACTKLLSPSKPGAPAISVTIPQHELVDCSLVIDKAAQEVVNPTCPILSGKGDVQHAIGKCATVSPRSSSQTDAQSPIESDEASKTHVLKDCDINVSIDDTTITSAVAKQHALEDCDETAGSTEQSDISVANTHFIPPPSSTPSTVHDFSPQNGRRTPSAADSALHQFLGALGGEPLDGSSDMIDKPEVALDIGIAAPAPSVSMLGSVYFNNKPRNKNRKQAQRNRTRY